MGVCSAQLVPRGRLVHMAALTVLLVCPAGQTAHCRSVVALGACVT